MSLLIRPSIRARLDQCGLLTIFMILDRRYHFKDNLSNKSNILHGIDLDGKERGGGLSRVTVSLNIQAIYYTYTYIGRRTEGRKST